MHPMIYNAEERKQNKINQIEAIRTQARDFGITYGKLCEVAGLSNTNLSLWIAGKRNPKDDSIERLAAALGMLLEGKA